MKDVKEELDLEDSDLTDGQEDQEPLYTAQVHTHLRCESRSERTASPTDNTNAVACTY